ncbi:MAG: UDP-N-acetylmuramate--L-alanine ligase [Ruminococcaceae bacterium]|nr:UDP-N-acetylmuramate--L-alanine ligase [Oscillospiraceae bacterium]
MSVSNTHFGANRISEMLKECKSVFFCGIGGINMSSLAHISLVNGMRVGGSDRTPSALTQKLENEGVEVFYTHSYENVENYDAFVYTVAIGEDNPEYVRAIERKIPVISRADYMGYLMTGYEKRIGISGMHGKSTATSMCANLLMGANTDPTVLSGAVLDAMGGAYRVGSNEYFLFEACEYMDSFLDFNPNIAVILNIELDHVDYFESLEHVKRSYRSFADIAIRNGGFVIANGDDKNVLDALCGAENVIYFAIDSENALIKAQNITEKNGKYAFDLLYEGNFVCHIELSVSGYHNIYNALATAGVALLCGVDAEFITSGIATFTGAARRMEFKGTLNGARVYDDYGHHPTEVATTLDGVKKMLDGGRLFCVFQSHTYSRTKALLDDFISALSVADRVIVADIYAARETDTLGITPELMAEKIKGGVACHGFENIAKMLCSELKDGDIAVVMGAGDIWQIFEHLKFD